MNRIFSLAALKYIFSVALLFLFCSSTSAAPTVASLKNNGAELNLTVVQHKLRLKVNYKNKSAIDLFDIQFNSESALDWQIEKTSDNELVLDGQFPASVEFLNRPTERAPKTIQLNIKKAQGGFRIFSEAKWATATALKLNYVGDHFFGLSEPLQPNNQLSPDLTGAHIVVDVNSEQEKWHENFASAYSAFYLSSFGYGSFFDSFARGEYDFSINGINQIKHDTGKLDWYLFFGENGTEIHRHYFSLIGAPKSVPAWGLGAIGWRDQNNGGAPEMLADIKHLRELQMPFTAWFVDRPYSEGANLWSKMNFNSLFANPAQWIQQIRNQEGLEFMSWTSTATFGDQVFAKHFAGKFSYIDLSDAASAEAFKNALTKNQHSVGVKGHKIDRADEAFPEYEDWADTKINIAERRNLYPYLAAKIHDEALRKTWGADQITFMRAAYQRSQPYLSALWGGDPRTSWDGLASNYANAMRSSLIGFPVWGTDVGGYQNEGYIPEDLYLRWLQAGSMSGLFEIKFDGAGGAGRDRLPWQYSENFQQQVRNILQQRMLFLPYLYSLANTSATNGVLMQPLVYRNLQDKKTYSIWDEFYLGDAILVAPIFSEKNSRNIYLPEGRWIDFDNTKIIYQGGRSIQVDVPLSRLPRFIAENSIYVQGNIYQGSDRFWNNQKPQLAVVVSPAMKNQSTHFDYVDLLDSNKQKTFLMQRTGNKIELKIPAINNETKVEVLLAKAPKSVLLNGKIIAMQFNIETGKLLIPLVVENDSAIEISL